MAISRRYLERLILTSEPYREHCINRHGFRPAPDTSRPRAYPIDPQTLAELPFKVASGAYKLPPAVDDSRREADEQDEDLPALDEPPPLISIHDFVPRAQ